MPAVPGAQSVPHFSRRRSFFLSSLIVGGLLGGAEVVLRLVGVASPVRPALVARTVDIDIEFPFMRADAELLWALRPGYRGEFLGRPVSINALGLRGADVAVGRSPGRRRVACFGDSITFGYGVADDETYAARLDALLSARGVEAVNAGVTGYTTYQVLRHLRRLAPRVEMDVASFCVGWNDASSRPVDDPTYARRMRAATALDGLARHVYLYRWAKGLYVNAMMGRAEREWETGHLGNRVPPDQYRDNLAAIVSECRSRGIRPVFVGLPRRRRPGESAPVPPHAAVLQETAARLGVPLVDVGDLGLEATSASNEAYFIDNLHLSVAGHRYLADQLARSIR
jgi:lysophospholipase L1-like esterase